MPKRISALISTIVEITEVLQTIHPYTPLLRSTIVEITEVLQTGQGHGSVQGSTIVEITEVLQTIISIPLAINLR